MVWGGRGAERRGHSLTVCVCLQVFSYVATLLYFIHTILSAIRWKSF